MSVLIWISVACLALASGVALWGIAQQKQEVSDISQRVQRVLDAEPTEVVSYEFEQGQKKQLSSWLGFAPDWLKQGLTKGQWILALSINILIFLLFGWFASFWIALIIPVSCGACIVFFAWLKWQKKRARLVQQLPSFIDGMVRMVVLGHAAQSAFVLAASSAKEPLSHIVLQAAAFAKAGMPIDQALVAANRDLKLQEFNLLASVIHVGGRFGGRVDSLLERVAHLMRDREQANTELRALSAEVRVSAWILSLLPILVGGAIIVLNAGYFMKMLDDPAGKWIAASGMALQLVGTVLLYRLAQLDD